MKNFKKFLSLVSVLALLASCANTGFDSTSSDLAETIESSTIENEESVKLTVAAAASLEYSFKDELIPLFQEKYPNVIIEGTYDSSGKLQTQIEEGLEADIFMSAAPKQMNALIDEKLIDSESVVDLLENQIVLIAPVHSNNTISSFEEITQAKSIALGDPASVPVGQYAEESLTSLGVFDEIQSKVSYGTNVTEVLNWVAEGSADVGIVYATDAAVTDKVKIIATAPSESLKSSVIYPVGVLTHSKQKEMAENFVEFLSSSEALEIFEKYGFKPNV